MAPAAGNAAMLEDDRLSDGALHGHHDPWLVVLSIAIAVLASFAALDLMGRMRETSGRPHAGWWLAGAVAMGGGIWSMHFVAMLSFQLGMVVIYDVWMTVLSLVIAIVVSGLGLFIVAQTAKRHGGRAFAQSEGVGRGATFTLELPSAPSARSLHV